MGAKFLHTIVQPTIDLAASAAITPFDLPVNPLSFLLLRFQLTNVAPAALDTYQAIDDLITQITRVAVVRKGESIIDGSLRDLVALNAYFMGAYPGIAKLIDTDNAIRSIVFPLLLGRRMYDPVSCFPAVPRGNLRFEMTAGADGAGYDDVNFSVEAVELIEAEPTEHLKYTTSSRDSVIGQFDATLPIGNALLGVLLFDTGLFGADDEVLSWGQIKLLVDNVEQYYPLSDFEVLAGQFLGRVMKAGTWPGHVHQFDGAAVGLDDSDAAQVPNSHGLHGYAALDFDPLGDGMYELITEGMSDLIIRGNGDEATAIRWLPLERVMVAARA